MSNAPRSAAWFVTSISAKVTCTGGASSSNPCDQAWKTNVSFGHGEWASMSGAVLPAVVVVMGS